MCWPVLSTTIGSSRTRGERGNSSKAKTVLAYGAAPGAGVAGGIRGKSPELAEVVRQIEQVAVTDAIVLITGESGTGKELVAQAIHEHSRRSKRAFVKVNCAAVPRDLFESEFFGHVRGAFTGASQDRQGRFQLANQGTLFLDEVGEIPLELQSKLLRVLQDGTFERVGQSVPRTAAVRVIAATDRDLRAEVSAGRFRSDLYYRLAVFPIEIPPLRQRRDDIAPLVDEAVGRVCARLGFASRPSMTQHHLALLSSYDWPGNVRELYNVIERALILTGGRGIEHSLSSQQRRAGRAGLRQPARRGDTHRHGRGVDETAAAEHSLGAREGWRPNPRRGRRCCAPWSTAIHIAIATACHGHCYWPRIEPPPARDSHRARDFAARSTKCTVLLALLATICPSAASPDATDAWPTNCWTHQHPQWITVRKPIPAMPAPDTVHANCIVPLRSQLGAIRAPAPTIADLLRWLSPFRAYSDRRRGHRRGGFAASSCRRLRRVCHRGESGSHGAPVSSQTASGDGSLHIRDFLACDLSGAIAYQAGWVIPTTHAVFGAIATALLGTSSLSLVARRYHRALAGLALAGVVVLIASPVCGAP